MKYSDTTQAVDTRNLEISCVNVTWKAHIFTDNTYIPQAAFPDLLEGPEMRDMICHHTMDHMHFVDSTSCSFPRLARRARDEPFARERERPVRQKPPLKRSGSKACECAWEREKKRERRRERERQRERERETDKDREGNRTGHHDEITQNPFTKGTCVSETSCRHSTALLFSNLLVVFFQHVQHTHTHQCVKTHKHTSTLTTLN